MIGRGELDHVRKIAVEVKSHVWQESRRAASRANACLLRNGHRHIFDVDRFEAGHFSRSSVRRQVDFAQVLFHVGLHRQGYRVQDICGFVHPAPLICWC